MLNHENVREYYGKVLRSKADLKTSACCASNGLPPHLASAFASIPSAVTDRSYGCSTPIPPALEGATVLDLGCGTGTDCFLLSKMVGENGKVIGVDMTDDQLAVAQQHRAEVAKLWGYSASNIDFRLGIMEDLAESGVEAESADVVISNCVFNLAPDKSQIFAEVYRALRPNGELYFSDVVSDRRLSKACQDDPVAVGECLGGALYERDLMEVMQSVGFADVRIIERAPIQVEDQRVAQLANNAQFSSVTVRAFKIDLEIGQENYGHRATYLGSIPFYSDMFVLDEHNQFASGQTTPVSRNTSKILQSSRYGKFFCLNVSSQQHLGKFEPEVGDTKQSSCC